MFTHSLTESGLTLFPLFCSGAISWRFPLAASEAALRIPLPRVKARGMPNAPSPLPILRLRFLRLRSGQAGQAKEGKDGARIVNE